MQNYYFDLTFPEFFSMQKGERKERESPVRIVHMVVNLKNTDLIFHLKPKGSKLMFPDSVLHHLERSPQLVRLPE